MSSLMSDMLKSKIKLKEDKSPGDDGITPKFLKNVVDEIAQPLTEIFNRCIKGRFCSTRLETSECHSSI